MSTILGADGFAVTPSNKGAAAPVDGSGDAIIKDGSQDTFMTDVIEASQSTPVIVDFWAPWCGPCKTLTPALEAAVTAAGGKVKLVKVNVDENQEIAGQLRIQSIPTVYGFVGGQPVDGFAGAQPESAIRQFIERLVSAAVEGGGMPDVDVILDHAEQFLQNGEIDDAAHGFQEVMKVDQRNPRALAGFLKCMMARDKMDECRMLLEQLPDEMKRDPLLLSVQAELDLAAQPAVESSEIEALRARVAADPKDHQARIDLAEALYKAKDKEAAVDQLLESIAIDRAWNEDAARKALLKLFEAMGPTDPVTQDARRRLSAILFS